VTAASAVRIVTPRHACWHAQTRDRGPRNAELDSHYAIGRAYARWRGNDDFDEVRFYRPRLLSRFDGEY
jgi:hypothetical protein